MNKKVIVNLTTHRAYYYEDNQLIKEYPVGSGKAETPTHPAATKLLRS